MRCVGVAVFSGHTMACPYKRLLTYHLPPHKGYSSFRKEENLRNCPYKVGIGEIKHSALSTQHS